MFLFLFLHTGGSGEAGTITSSSSVSLVLALGTALSELFSLVEPPDEEVSDTLTTFSLFFVKGVVLLKRLVLGLLVGPVVGHQTLVAWPSSFGGAAPHGPI